MRAEPPSSRPDRQERQASKPALVRHRCPYLEQILRERAGPFGWLNRFKVDCHVDRKVHRFTGRHPQPPCITDPETCALYRSAKADEDRQISRYTD